MHAMCKKRECNNNNHNVTNLYSVSIYVTNYNVPASTVNLVPWVCWLTLQLLWTILQYMYFYSLNNQDNCLPETSTRKHGHFSVPSNMTIANTQTFNVIASQLYIHQGVCTQTTKVLEMKMGQFELCVFHKNSLHQISEYNTY